MSKDKLKAALKSKAGEERHKYYRDTERLLKVYRDVRWNLKLSMEHHRQDFEMEYGMSLTEYLDDVYAAGIDFAGTALEHHANSMKRTAEMLKLIDTATHLIRENNSEGETFYWILYYTYLSPLKMSSMEEVVNRVHMHIPHVTIDTYYRHRKRTINTFSSVLWGFTTKDDSSILDAFV